MIKKLLLFMSFIMAISLATNAQKLIVHYKLDETSDTIVSDASGNGNDGYVSGTATWTDGEIDGAFEFDGSSNITLPNSLGLTSDKGSVSLWLNCEAPVGNMYTLFWAGDNSTGGGFGAENEMHIHIEEEVSSIWSGGELGFWVMGAESTGVHIYSDATKESAGIEPIDPILMGDSEWHHIVTTWGEGYIQMYIDNALIMETAYASASYNLDTMFLGQMGSGGRAYTGIIDDFRLYSGVIYDTGVDSLYNKLEPTAINDVNSQGFYLNESCPNPFSGTTTISYQLTRSSDVLLTVYNQLGQKVRTLVQEKQVVGKQSVTWDGCNNAGQQLTPGIYMCRLQANSKVQTRKIMLVR